MNVQNRLYIMKTEFLEEPEQFNLWYQRMPDYRKKKIDAFKPLKSKILSLGAGVLLYRAMEDAGISTYEVECGEKGKPFIKGYDNLYFNISHSEEVVVLGISNKEIGVDVEKIRHFENKLVDYVFTSEDKKVSNQLKKEPDVCYTMLWTIKESIMKHSGKGTGLAPKAITLRLDNGEIKASSDEYNCERLHLLIYEIPKYRITICSEDDSFVTEYV